ncbi:MAG: iron complex outerrane recepter protein, partial [Gammaproteobacteria bacterium]|nr:iron complex outerrane recepter protein [Gammaproteobacteria bacterium]
MTKHFWGAVFAVAAGIQCMTASAIDARSEDGTAAAAAAPAGADEIGEIIVTAQRRSESLERTPVAIAALGGDTLARQAILTETDLQTAVPGLTVKAGQGSNQLNYSLRGQTVDAFSDSRPSVLPYFNEVQVGGSASSAFYDLDSVQVLKGPQGTLFGRNSTGGAVLFTTVKPTNEFGGYVTVGGGNYGLYKVEGAVNVPLIEDKVLLRVAGYTESHDGYQYNLFNGKRVGDVERANGRVSLTIKPIAGITNELVIDYGRSGGGNISSVVYTILPAGNFTAFVPNNVLYSPAADALFGPNTFANFLAAHPGRPAEGIVAFTAEQRARGPFVIDVDAPNFHRAKNVVVSNISKFDVGVDTQIKNILGYTHQVTNDGAEFDGTPYPADSNGTAGRGGTLRQLSEEAQLVGKTYNQKLAYVTGVYFSDEKNDVHSSSVIFDFLPVSPPVNQINVGETKNRTYAGYAQGSLDLSEMVGVQGLGVTGGGRYSSEKVTFLHLPGDTYLVNPNPAFVTPLSDTFNKFSWQFGLQEQFNPDVLLYAVTRRSFRSGGFNFFAPPLPGFGNDGGSEYKPETATDVEIGTKFQGDVAGMPARLNVAAYNMWIDDIQRSNYVQIFGNLAGITVNVPKAVVTGIEFDGLIKPVRALSLGGSLNFTDARFTNNVVSVLQNPAVAFGPYPDTPRWSGTVYADVTVPVTDSLRASLRGDVYEQSSMYFSSTANTLNPGSQIPG